MNIRNRVKELRHVKASELRPNPRNWRTHPVEQVDALKGVLAEIGYAGAALARELPDGTLELIDGHARAEVTGDGTMPVLVLDVNEDEANKILATFDPLGALAGTDADKLSDLLDSVQFDNDAVNAMLDDLSAIDGDELPTPGGGGDDFDATPSESGPTRAQPGDLWVIGGKHRLIVGDNTDPENVRRLMDGKTVGLCFTSPPYAQQRDYGDVAKEKVQDWYALMCGTFANLPMADDGQVLVNLGLIHRDGEWVPYWEPWIEWMRSQGWRRFGWYVWDQGSGLPGDWNGRLAPSHEWMFHFNRLPIRPEKIIDKKPESIKAKKASDGGLRGSDGVVSRVSSPAAYMQPAKIPDSVIRIMRSHEKIRSEHPAVFPLSLSMFMLESWPFDVYDPFLGSGTTLIAAHRLNHICYGCEIEPKYADVILKRAEAEGLTCEKVD